MTPLWVPRPPSPSSWCSVHNELLAVKGKVDKANFSAFTFTVCFIIHSTTHCCHHSTVLHKFSIDTYQHVSRPAIIPTIVSDHNQSPAPLPRPQKTPHPRRHLPRKRR